MSEAKHTELPWYISQPSMGFSTLCQSGTQEVIFGLAAPQQSHGDKIGEEETKANAEFIVRACNSHYELLAELKRTTRELKQLLEYLGKWNPNDVRNTTIKMLIGWNEAAINKATEAA